MADGINRRGLGRRCFMWYWLLYILWSVVDDAMIKIRLRIDGSYGKILKRERGHFYGERPISYYKSFYCSIF